MQNDGRRDCGVPFRNVFLWRKTFVFPLFCGGAHCYLRGAGDTFYTAVASTISVTIIRTLGSYLGGYVFGLGIVGIWLGVLADQISRFIFATVRFKAGKWTEIKI